MKKIMNQPSAIVDEMIQGLTKSYPDYVSRLENTNVIVRSDLKNMSQTVGLVSGGGSGHEPSHAGFVGEGMLTAAVCGEVFTSPTPDQIFEAIKASDTGKGVFLIIKNYSGDVMNFDMAKDMAEMEGIKVDSIIVDDDIAVEDSTYTQGRRGVAGTVLVHKILGGLAAEGASLEEISDFAKQLVPQIKTIGLALTGATVPEVGKPGFVLADDEIEYGVGIHGEPGYRKEKIKTSYEFGQELIGRLSKEFQFKQGDTYGILVNGLGATPLMEQFVFINDVLNQLDETGLKIAFTKVGNYMTSLEMAGISLTLIKLENRYLELLNKSVHTIAW